ncbi:MAG: hypothetical protein GY774_37455 [Planctomycetes bacterium]|nr:hypothetical protein [Planctomycetota bacterium]
MNDTTIGLIGGIIGGVLGCIGGIIGTYFSIKNVNDPRERTFMVKCVVVGWIAIAVFLTLLFLLPHPYRYLLWILYGIALPLGIHYGNRKQNMIRESEKGA